jgi:hypothetical protein
LKSFLLSNVNRNLPSRLLYTIVSLRWIPNVGKMRFIYGGTGGRENPPEALAAKRNMD